MAEAENQDSLYVAQHPNKEIYQGDIFWVEAENSEGSELGQYPHPYVVIQENLFNQSRIHTVVVCALTTNLKKAGLPGNVLLDSGEANLPKQSVIEVSKISSVAKIQLGDKIGTLAQDKIDQVLAGIRFLQSSSFMR
ncbi:MAG: type II toxin-antitoxin system PemK/MazF family toxin [Anaerolineae bacterium]